MVKRKPFLQFGKGKTIRNVTILNTGLIVSFNLFGNPLV